MNDLRLLILDDDPQVGRMIQLIAESVGFCARFMTSTTEFFQSLDHWQPTHLVVDLVMPQMDGVEVLQRLASDRCRATVIITSGVGTRALAQARLSAAEQGLEVLGTLSKPFAPQNLRGLLVGRCELNSISIGQSS